MELITGYPYTILHIKTELTLKNSGFFQGKMAEMLSTESSFHILDLSNVQYLNGSSLAIISKAALKARESDQELLISGVQPPISEIFDIIGFNAFMRFFATRDEAVCYVLLKGKK